MSDVADQIENFKGVRRPRFFGQRTAAKGEYHGRAAMDSDDKVFVDAVCSKRLGSDELLAQLEAVGVDSEAIAGHIKSALDNPKLSPRDRRMLVSQVLRIIEQAEGKKIKVDPTATSQEQIQAELDATVAMIEDSTGQSIERLRLVNGPDPSQPHSASSGTEGADRESESGSARDIPTATEG